MNIKERETIEKVIEVLLEPGDNSSETGIELDAVKPEKLQTLCEDAIESVFDRTLYDELVETEDQERELYQSKLREFVSSL